MNPARSNRRPGAPLLAGLALALLAPPAPARKPAAPAPAAPEWREYFPETKVGNRFLPAASYAAGAPFIPGADQADGALRREGRRVWLEASAQGSRRLRVRIYRAALPTAAEITAALRAGEDFPLSTEPTGEPVFSKEFAADEALVTRWRAAFERGARDPAGLLSPWARKQANQPRRNRRGRDDRLIHHGFRWDAIGRFQAEAGDLTHSIDNSLQGSWHTRPRHDELRAATYGSDQDGWRPAPFIALRPRYQLRFRKTVELPGPGAYVVVTEGDTRRAAAPFVYSQLEAVSRRVGNTVYLAAADHADGAARPGAAAAVYFVPPRALLKGAANPSKLDKLLKDMWKKPGLRGLKKMDFNQARPEVTRVTPALEAAGRVRFEVPGGTETVWVVLRDGPHFRAISGGGYQKAAAAPPRKGRVRRPRPNPSGESLVHLTTDRPIYKPGETVKFRGVARRLVGGVEFDVLAGDPVKVTLGWGNGPAASAKTDELGAFHGELVLPDDQRTGTHYLRANVEGGGGGQLPIKVEAYRKPEHEVLVEAAEPWTAQGDTATFKLRGRFTVGGDLGGARVKYTVRSETPEAAPFEANLRRWCGGPGWSWRPPVSETGLLREEGDITLREDGRFEVPVTLPAGKNDYAVRLRATLVSPDGREVKGSGTFYAPRAAVVAGLRSTMGLVEPGEPWRVRGALKDMEGNPAGGAVTLRLQRHVYEQTAGRWKHRVEDLRTWRETVPASGEVDWPVALEKAGEIQLTMTATDAKGRETSAQVRTYRFGKDSPGFRGDRIEAKADKDEYAAGETATVLVRLPLSAGTLWYSLEGEAYRRGGRVEFTGYNALVKVPLTAADAPEAKLHLEAIKDGRRIENTLTLEVPALAHQADLALTPDARVYKPGAEVTLDVRLRDAAGRPLAGDVCLAVYDEALLQVAKDATPDPYQFFFGTRRNKVGRFESWHGRYGLEARRKRGVVAEALSGGAMMKAMARAPAPMAQAAGFADMEMSDELDAAPMDKNADGGGIQIRSEFRDVAHWVGSARTGADGRATLTFRLPDDLARWRLVAYAVDAETRVAKTVGRVVARKDLMVRMGLPRFLTTGDHILVKASVQNMREAPARGALTFETLGARPVPLGEKDLETLGVRLDPASGWLVTPAGPVRKAPDRYDLTVPAKGHDAVDFPIYVHDYPDSGVMKFESVFDSAGEGDGLRKEIPVVPFGRRQTVVTVREVADAATLEVAEKPGTFAGATSVALDLMLNLEQAARTALVDDLETLIDYRYGCTEQTLSRFVPLAIARAELGDGWLAAAGVDADLGSLIDAGVKRLKELRKGDGWGWAPGGEASSSTTAYLISRVYRLPPAARDDLVKRLDLPRAVRWLRGLYEQNSKAALDREERADEVSRMLNVYRVFEALSLAGEDLELPRLPVHDGVLDSPRFWTCYGAGAARQGDPDEAGLAAQRLDHAKIGNDAFYTWRHRGGRYGWYGDDAETAALVLEFMADGPGGIETEAFRGGLRWLVQGEGASRYRSTKARAVSVAVAARYLAGRAATGVAGDSEVTVTAGRTQRRTVAADPRAKRRRVFVEAPELRAAGNRIEVTRRSGPGVFVRQDTTYFYKGPFAPRDEGFGVRSRLELDGDPHPSHARLRRVVSLTVPRPQTFAMLEVPLLSGGEVDTEGEHRPSLERKDREGRWHRTWQQVDVLDDRVVFYFDYLAAGEYRVTVPVTPEIAGFHNMLPARCFLMYFPHVEGTSESHRVSIGR